MNKRSKFLIIFLAFITFALNAQEALLSVEEQYFDFLALNGEATRNYLNYRTLSDSVWTDLSEDSSENFWAANLTSNFSINDKASIKIYSPDLFNSYNSAAPYGQNDGGLWQGKGYNASFKAGARLEAYGFEITFFPQLSFSQNASFDYPSPNYKDEAYKNKASDYGYYGLKYIDAPQRFGNKAFWNFDFGDSEIRYSYKNFTMGFGTQSIWLGPAQVNPILHSNNGATYPKIDLGLRKQTLQIGDIFFGNLEFRYWLGKLTESKYFDNNESNNDNLMTALSLSYEPPFFDGLILGFHRTMLSYWSNISPYTTMSIFIPWMKNKMGYDESDQRASLTAEYYIPKGQLSLYMEWAKNDYNRSIDNILRYPFHTQALTAGFKKNINFSSAHLLKSQIVFELSYLESSMDYHFFYDWGGSGNSFYTHHLIKQGYTNKGQYLGAGIGSGGNSQYFSYRLYYPKGDTTFFCQRVNPDLNYFYFQAERDNTPHQNDNVKSSISVNVILGLESIYYLNSNLRLTGAFIFEDQHNPLNKNDNDYNSHGVKDSEHRYNFITQFGIKYLF
ncbi:MAG: capsule assembly Wzi family protein [Treponema sp.]|nr:capsule assembly Wzi family protein [Treponema sp.]